MEITPDLVTKQLQGLINAGGGTAWIRRDILVFALGDKVTSTLQLNSTVLKETPRKDFDRSLMKLMESDGRTTGRGLVEVDVKEAIQLLSQYKPTPPPRKEKERPELE